VLPDQMGAAVTIGNGVLYSVGEEDSVRTGFDLIAGDNEVFSRDGTNGLILYSPDGTAYRVTVANGGTLSVGAV
jgi:hypothetical protein